MKIKKIDNYQSWYIESEDTALIIDPWLDKVMQPKSNFFINRTRNESALITDEMIDKVACILISAPFEDHFHEKSLKRFDPSTLVLTSKPSVKKLKKIGFNNIETLRAGAQKNIGDLLIRAHDAGFPYNYLWLNNFSTMTKVNNKFELDYWGVSTRKIAYYFNSLEDVQGCIISNRNEGIKAFLNKKICFLHPKSTSGVLIEICQKKTP